MRVSRKNNKKNRGKKKNRAGRRGGKRWIALGAVGAMMACTVPDSGKHSLVFAQRASSAWVATYLREHSQSQALRFDIPPGPMDTVVSSFEALTGWKVVLSNEDIRSILSPGVSGLYSVEQALKQLLAGTGIAYKITGPETVTLEVMGPASSVVVKGEIPLPSSPKYTEPLRDIPQTINIIPQSIIKEQGATTLRDVLRNVPGLTIAAGEGGTPAGDNLTLRGFSARNDIFIDGVRDLSPQARDPFNLEQVEVVKGPGSVYTGRGSAGGTINLVSKSPGINRFFDATLNLGSDETKRITADFNTPVKDRSAFRLNFMAHESGVAGRHDAVRNQRWGIAPSLAMGIGTQTRMSFSLFHLQQDNVSDYGIPWVPNTNNVLVEHRDRPAPVPRDTFYGFKDRDFEKLRSDYVTFRLEHDLNDSTTLRNQFRYGQSKRDSIATPPRFASPDSTIINREMRSWIATDEIADNQTDLRSRFSTGGVSHSLVAGLALSNENNVRRNRTAPDATTTLLNPNPNDVYTGEITISPNEGNITGKSLALYAFDTVRLGQHWELTGGLRWDYFDVDGVTTANATVARIDRMLSWRAGVVFKPVLNGSIYASYGTSLNPSLEGLSYNTANVLIDPEKTYTAEIGTKWDLLKDRLSLSLAGFRVDKTNARTPSILPDEPPQVLEGRQRVYGAEFGASGSINRNWTIFAAYTYLDSEILRSNNPQEVGREFQNTPKNSASVWTSYRFPRNLNLGGGLRFIDDRFGNNINTRRVDSYYTIDAVASYPLTSHLDLRLNLYNLNDAFYFDRLGGGHLIP
ncbi:MAG TPA: TonB-dependent siderophore receptor, partial [Blastocatellia bacterium]|nr:TonB-dependent siderophore receptor [Blastocatellia bacterium]